MAFCFECGAQATHAHHVVPRSLGGTKTLPLCSRCHPRAHGKRGHWSTSELTKKALAKMRAQGRFAGGSVPYGFTVSADGFLEVDPEKICVRHLIKLWRAAGITLPKICKDLDQMLIPTKHARAGWKDATIRKICKNP